MLDVVCDFDSSARVVVIDDGSQDDTARRAAEYPVEVLRYDINRGKGAALETGILHVGRARRWVFLDADLINLTHGHIATLLRPLEENPDVGMVVGRFIGGQKMVDWAQRFVSILNGQRALSGTVVPRLPGLSWSRFGVEVFLSMWMRHQGIEVAEPLLAGLTHHAKEQKRGTARGVLDRISMWRECLRALRIWRRYVDGPRISGLEPADYTVYRAD